MLPLALVFVAFSQCDRATFCCPHIPCPKQTQPFTERLRTKCCRRLLKVRAITAIVNLFRCPNQSERFYYHRRLLLAYNQMFAWLMGAKCSFEPITARRTSFSLFRFFGLCRGYLKSLAPQIFLVNRIERVCLTSNKRENAHTTIEYRLITVQKTFLLMADRCLISPQLIAAQFVPSTRQTLQPITACATMSMSANGPEWLSETVVRSDKCQCIPPPKRLKGEGPKPPEALNQNLHHALI